MPTRKSTLFKHKFPNRHHSLIKSHVSIQQLSFRTILKNESENLTSCLEARVEIPASPGAAGTALASRGRERATAIQREREPGDPWPRW